MIIVADSVSKKAYFASTYTTITVKYTVRLFLHHTWKLHGLSNCIFLDQELQFVVLFTKELYSLLSVEITLFIAWHPQTDGKTEQVNQELK